MTAADQPTTEASAEVPLVYSVDRSWESRMRVDANDDPYDSRKMHRTWPSDDDRYGTAACSRRIILNIEDEMPADDDLIVEGMLCRRCIPDQPPVEAPRPVLMEWAQRAVERESAPAPQPAADTEREVQWGVRGDVRVFPIDVPDQPTLDRLHRAGAVVVRRTATVTPWEEA